MATRTVHTTPLPKPPTSATYGALGSEIASMLAENSKKRASKLSALSSPSQAIASPLQAIIAPIQTSFNHGLTAARSLSTFRVVVAALVLLLILLFFIICLRAMRRKRPQPPGHIFEQREPARAVDRMAIVYNPMIARIPHALRGFEQSPVRTIVRGAGENIMPGPEFTREFAREERITFEPYQPFSTWSPFAHEPPRPLSPSSSLSSALPTEDEYNGPETKSSEGSDCSRGWETSEGSDAYQPSTYSDISGSDSNSSEASTVRLQRSQRLNRPRRHVRWRGFGTLLSESNLENQNERHIQEQASAQLRSELYHHINHTAATAQSSIQPAAPTPQQIAQPSIQPAAQAPQPTAQPIIQPAAPGPQQTLASSTPERRRPPRAGRRPPPRFGEWDTRW